MLTVLSVLRSGGIYDAEWVRKLRDAVARNLTIEHRFVCLADDDYGWITPCEPLLHNWPGWWAKIELFRPGVIIGPTLYIDLDNVVVGDLAPLTACEHDFAMLRNFNRADYASSCVMWFGKEAPSHVYEKFAADPDGWMRHHETHRSGPYLGDQAFIWECFGCEVPFIEVPKLTVSSYRKDVMRLGYVPPEAVMVAFGGSHKPNTTKGRWLREAWV